MVHLDVSAIGGHEVFVDVGSGLSDARLRRVDAAPAANLPEQPLAAAAYNHRYTKVKAEHSIKAQLHTVIGLTFIDIYGLCIKNVV